MPKPTKGPRLGGGPAHERLLLANLAQALFEHERITTTETKAKRLRPVAERLITFAKRGDLHARRRVLSIIGNKAVVHKLFTEIAPQVADREGGYTRVIKTGFRKGDNAPMAVIELVLEPVAKKSRAAAKPATESKPAAKTPAAATDGGYGADSAAPLEDGASPDSEKFTVKGNKDSMKYHTPDSQWYESTVAEVWFTTAEAAEKAGFAAPGGSHATEKVDADEAVENAEEAKDAK